MQIKSNFKIREIAGEYIIVNQGNTADLTKIISLNESARLLFEELSGKEFEAEDIADVLVEAYGIERGLASKDAASWLESMKKCGILE